MSDARYLLSDAALPQIASRPSPRARTEHRFRLPTCIGKPADYKLARPAEPSETAEPRAAAEPRADATPNGRFAERTMKWFNVGEDQAEEERRDHLAMIRDSQRRRRIAAIAASVGALALAALAIVLI